MVSMYYLAGFLALTSGRPQITYCLPISPYVPPALVPVELHSSITMTTIQSPSRLPTPSSSVGRQPKAPKLRDSCHACASSKLKCNKEKPTCSRCTKRGITCEYVATKRGGRKHDPKPSLDDSVNNPPSATAAVRASQSSQSPSSWFGPPSALTNTDPLPSPGVTQVLPQSPPPSTSSTLFPNYIFPSDQSLSSVFTELTNEFDDFNTSPVSFPLPDVSDSDFLRQTDILPTGVTNSNSSSTTLFDTFSVNEDAASDLFAFSNFPTHPNSRASPVSDFQNHQPFRTNDLSCICLARALGLLNQLFPTHSSACKASSAMDIHEASPAPTIQAVISKNEETVEAVSAMLQCSCSQDGYLLTILSLVVFKVLSWYAAAARKTRSSSGDHGKQMNNDQEGHQSHSEHVLLDPTTIGKYSLEGEDSARMAAQLVLSELHRVQRLVNQLSIKFKLLEAKDCKLTDVQNHVSDECTNGKTGLPLSKPVLDMLGEDMRKRLKSLSLEIVEALRWS